MSQVTASSVFNPQVLAQLVSAGFANMPVLYGSNVVAKDFTAPYGPEYLGTTVSIPYVYPPTDWDILSDGSALTPFAFGIGNAAGNSTTPESETVLRAGKSMDMTTWARVNPQDPYGEARKQMLLGFAQAMESQLITKATDSTGWSSYTLDISSNADPLIAHDTVVSGTALLGAEGFNDRPAMLAVHSHTLETMFNRKNALGVPWLVEAADVQTPYGAEVYRLRPFGTLVLTSDRMPVDTGVYTSALLWQNSLALFVSPNISARSVQSPNTDSQVDALNAYFTAHRYKRRAGKSKPGVVLLKHK